MQVDVEVEVPSSGSVDVNTKTSSTNARYPSGLNNSSFLCCVCRVRVTVGDLVLDLDDELLDLEDEEEVEYSEAKYKSGPALYMVALT